MKEGQKVGSFPVLVFLINPPFKIKKPEKCCNLKKLYSLLVRRSAAERNKIARTFGGEKNQITRSFGGKRNKIARRYRRKGISWLGDVLATE